MTKQIKITIETESLLLLRGRNSSRVRCPLCNTESEMVALENLQVVSNLDRRSFEEWINSGELHHLEADDGSPLICLNSLLARICHKTTI
jgi:LSD1 subclass zinc finger protein